MRKYDGSASVSLRAAVVSASAGDSFGFSAVGTTLRLFHKPVNGSWTQIGADVVDSTYSSGYLGLEFDESVSRIEDFGGGFTGTSSDSRDFRISADPAPSSEISRDFRIVGDPAPAQTAVDFKLRGLATTFPSTGILDDFNRGDGSVGANWTALGGTWAISSNQLTNTSSSGALY